MDGCKLCGSELGCLAKSCELQELREERDHYYNALSDIAGMSRDLAELTASKTAKTALKR